jgi:hypothetical protein
MSRSQTAAFVALQGSSGITFYRLDLATGDVLVQKQMDHMSPEGDNYHALVDNLSIPPGDNDVLMNRRLDS